MTNVLVVGAGTAGSVIAGRLSGRPDVHVTVLEAGPDLRPGDGAVGVRSASFFDALREPGRTWPSDYVQGRGIGGSSAVNGMVASVPGTDLVQRWGLDEVSSVGSTAGEYEHGPMDRALLAAAPDARAVTLARRDGARVTASDVHLEPARRRRAVEVMTDAQVARVVIDHGRAVGVELLDGTMVDADIVIVAAGAIHSPALLVRSGVELEPMDVFDHPSATLHLDLRSNVVVDVHSFVATTVLCRGDVEIVPMNHHRPDQPGRAAILVALMRPDGRGRIDVADDPAVEPAVRFDWTARDAQRLRAAETTVRDLLERPSFTDIVATVDATAEPGGYFHACGSCRRVVDGAGAVVGVDGLYVSDASTFPELPATGPMVLAVAWAERFAARF